MLSRERKTLFLVALLAVLLTVLAACGGGSAQTTAQIPQVTAHEVYERLPDLETGLILLDVRTPEEWINNGHIAGATLLPLEELGYLVSSDLPRDTEIIVYCHGGDRSTPAAEYLLEAGFTNIKELQGGIVAWAAAGMPVVTGP